MDEQWELILRRVSKHPLVCINAVPTVEQAVYVDLPSLAVALFADWLSPTQQACSSGSFSASSEDSEKQNDDTHTGLSRH